MDTHPTSGETDPDKGARSYKSYYTPSTRIFTFIYPLTVLVLWYAIKFSTVGRIPTMESETSVNFLLT